MIRGSTTAGPFKDRSWVLSYLSLFTSLSTLICCALPSLLVLLGLGAAVASTLSSMPWLVSLSHHKIWVFGISGTLILLSFVQAYVVTPRLQKGQESCTADDPTCSRAARVSGVLLWFSATIYMIGFITAFLLGPILSWLDRG
jgi:mercuric ion transport protein